MVELLRKMIMNGLISIILPDSPTQIIIGIGVSFSFLIHLMMTRPYKCETDTRLAFWCQLQIVVTLLAGLILREKIPFLGNLDTNHETETSLMTAIIITSHAGLLTYGLIAVVTERWFSHEQQILNRKMKEHELKMKRVQSNTKSTMMKARNLGKLKALKSTKVMPFAGPMDEGDDDEPLQPKKKMFAVDMIKQEQEDEKRAALEAESNKLGGFSWKSGKKKKPSPDMFVETKMSGLATVEGKDGSSSSKASEPDLRNDEILEEKEEKKNESIKNTKKGAMEQPPSKEGATKNFDMGSSSSSSSSSSGSDGSNDSD